MTPVISDDTAEIMSADKVIFPGQGEARNTMQYLREKGLDKVICGLRQPVLGICIGMQLMCRHSEEGDTACLGIFDVGVRKFVPRRQEDKVPHMGWNSLSGAKGKLFEGLPDTPFVYFVHSFYVPPTAHTAAESNHIVPFSAALHDGNFYATQFHPEKSGVVGETILRNFIGL